MGEVHMEYVKEGCMQKHQLICFNFFNFRPVSTKFPMNIEHNILTNRMFFNLVSKTFTFVVHNLLLIFIPQGYIQKVN